MTEEIRLGDIIQTRKKHPCGQDEWTVIRTGADIKIRCHGCGPHRDAGSRGFSAPPQTADHAGAGSL